MADDTRSLHQESRERRRLPSPAQQAVTGLLGTADGVRRHLATAIEPFGITGQQYNVLRILRGARPDPLPTLEIAERMMEQAPGITRLLDRLEAKGLVARERCVADRRQVLCSITRPGVELLGLMDERVDAADEAVVDALSRDELSQLLRLLDTIRGRLC